MQNKLIANIKLKFPVLTAYLDFLKSEGTLLDYNYPPMFFDALDLYEFARRDMFKSYVKYLEADNEYDVEVFNEESKSDIAILLWSYGIEDTIQLIEYLEENLEEIIIERYEDAQIDE